MSTYRRLFQCNTVYFSDITSYVNTEKQTAVSECAVHSNRFQRSKLAGSVQALLHSDDGQQG